MPNLVWPRACKLPVATRQRLPVTKLILVVEPAHAEANYGLATLLVELGRLEEATTKYRACSCRRPGLRRGKLRIGQTARTRRGAGGGEYAASARRSTLILEYVDAHLDSWHDAVTAASG